MQSPKISIITPNYNYGYFVGQTIESVLQQGYENVEHIIVDDGSTDHSIELINSYVSKWPGKVILISQENRGQSAALNVGFRKATGDVVGWINSDDTFCEGALLNIANAFMNNHSVEIVFGDQITIDNEGKVLRKIKQLPIDRSAGSVIGFAKLVASNTVFWRKRLFEKVGYVHEEFKCNMDGEFFSKLFYAGKALHIPHYIANFRAHPASQSSDFNPQKMKQYHFEQEFELKRSYKNLPISKVLPYKFSAPVRLLFRTKRVFQRLVSGHYF